MVDVDDDGRLARRQWALRFDVDAVNPWQPAKVLAINQLVRAVVDADGYPAIIQFPQVLSQVQAITVPLLGIQGAAAATSSRSGRKQDEFVDRAPVGCLHDQDKRAASKEGAHAVALTLEPIAVEPHAKPESTDTLDPAVSPAKGEAVGLHRGLKQVCSSLGNLTRFPSDLR
jgi:hypothetical protein